PSRPLGRRSPPARTPAGCSSAPSAGLSSDGARCARPRRPPAPAPCAGPCCGYTVPPQAATMSSERLSRGCLCAPARTAASGPPYRVVVCHCLDCRKAHGSIFRTFAIYPAGAVKLTGETATYAHAGKDRRHFCPRCGGQVLAEDGGDEVEVFVGAFDEPDRL